MQSIIDISIIIPHYNSFETLEKLLNSIPNVSNVEVIVIDDCSTKASDLFSKANYNHVIFTKTTKNSGAGTARNIGLEKACGKYVLFADSDDYFLNGFLDIVLPYTQSNLDCVFFKAKSVYLNTGKIADRHAYNYTIDTYLLFKDKWAESNLRFEIHVPWSKLIKLDFLKLNKIRFDETFIANDVMFSMKVGLNIKNFIASNDVIYCVTKNDFSITSNKSFNAFNSRLTVIIECHKFLKNNLPKNDFNLACSLIGIKTLLEAIKRKFTLKEKLQIFKRLYNENMLKPSLSIITKKILGKIYRKKYFGSFAL